jgi:hypothetical protein
MFEKSGWQSAHYSSTDSVTEARAQASADTLVHRAKTGGKLTAVAVAILVDAAVENEIPVSDTIDAILNTTTGPGFNQYAFKAVSEHGQMGIPGPKNPRKFQTFLKSERVVTK